MHCFIDQNLKNIVTLQVGQTMQYHRRPASIPETKQKKAGDSLWGSGQLYSTRNRIVLRRAAERNDLVADSMVSLIKRGLAKKRT